eukprot:COSAG06_NODE_1213_length_10240_cov_645.253525_2_plen_118_part_00
MDRTKNGSAVSFCLSRACLGTRLLAVLIRKEGSRENGAVFLNVMSGAEPPHQGGGRHGQDFRCAFDCDVFSVTRRNERSFAKTGSGQARIGGNVPLKEERFLVSSLSVRLPHTTQWR